MVENRADESAVTARRPRRRVPKVIAVIHVDNCTGCEACIAVCPVDCIALLATGQRVKGVDTWCEVDLERCIGCGLCVRIPKKEPYELTICPWDAIEMVAAESLPLAVAEMGGPATYVAKNQDHLLETARRVAAARRNQVQVT